MFQFKWTDLPFTIRFALWLGTMDVPRFPPMRPALKLLIRFQLIDLVIGLMLDVFMPGSAWVVRLILFGIKVLFLTFG